MLPSPLPRLRVFMCGPPFTFFPSPCSRVYCLHFVCDLNPSTLTPASVCAFATGDRVQLTAPDREQRLANRELGTIEQLQAKGETPPLDSGRTVALDVRAHPHLDYGYAVTSHSSQGQTADRVLVHIDLGRAGASLVNRRLA
jgi:ATP-dependent exoDNAse (exonuclease V) alpha subunit